MGFFDTGVGSVLGAIVGAGGASAAPNPTVNPNDPNSFNEATDAPYLSKLTDSLNSMSAPDPISAGTDSYQAKDMSSAALPEYQQMHDMAQAQNSTAKDEANDAISRRMAAMGMQSSGAAIKATENTNTQFAQQGQAAQNQIGFQEAQQRRALQQQEDQKAFTSSEALKGRQFSAQEFNTQAKNQFNEFKFDANSKIAGLDAAARAKKEQESVDMYNQQMNQYQARHSGGLLGSGGFLGTGIGTG